MVKKKHPADRYQRRLINEKKKQDAPQREPKNPVKARSKEDEPLKDSGTANL